MNEVSSHPVGQDGREGSGDWYKRLRLRKTSFSFPMELNTVKMERSVALNNEEKIPVQSNQHHLNYVRITNRFSCSSCNDGISFRPEDLTMHFKNVHGGKGNPQMFPCNLCSFSSSVFTTLQKHQRKHKECVFTCDICEDKVKCTFAQLIKHYKMQHSLNGLFYCLKCKLSIQEFEEFVCHSCPSLIKREESITNEQCDTQAKNKLSPPMTLACSQRWNRRNRWRKRTASASGDSKTSQDFKILLPKTETQWESTFLPLSTPSLLSNHDAFLDQEKILKDTKQFLERTTGLGNTWPVYLKNEQELVFSTPNNQAHPNLKSVGNDNWKLTGFMERNNISVPPDCITKMVRFKMVDGKKHLVFKVIPSNKRDDIESRSEASKPAHQTSTKVNESCYVSTVCSGKGSHAQVKPEIMESLRNKQECAAQQNFVKSVVERIKNIKGNDPETSDPNATRKLNLNAVSSVQSKPKHQQSSNGSDIQLHCSKRRKKPKTRQSCTDNDVESTLSKQLEKQNDVHHDSEANFQSSYSKILEKNVDPVPFSQAYIQISHSKRQKLCPEKAFIEPFTTWQADSGFHSDMTSEAPSLVDKFSSKIHKKQNLDPSLHLCSTVSFERISPASRSSMILSKSLCHFECEDEPLLFHSSPNDECTNNTDPRDLLVPLGQDQTLGVPMVHTLPLTTVTHLLDEVREVHALPSSHNRIEEPLRVVTCNAGSTLQSEPSNTRNVTLSYEDQFSCATILESSPIPIASLNKTISQETIPKSPKPSENITASTVHWEPSPRDSVRTLRLIPFGSFRSLRTLQGVQPLIVLNHPDSEIPEVTNIMRLIHKHKFTVQKVVLSRKTLKALSESDCFSASNCRREWPNGSVKEQFSLKLRIKRVCGKKYTVVPAESGIVIPQPMFRCWFCGRIFRNQEAWIGHGQRHLMEATRGWDQLFNQ